MRFVYVIRKKGTAYKENKLEKPRGKLDQLANKMVCDIIENTQSN